MSLTKTARSTHIRLLLPLSVLLGISCSSSQSTTGDNSALYLAIRKGDLASTRSLLDRGANPNSTIKKPEYRLVPGLRYCNSFLSSPISRMTLNGWRGVAMALPVLHIALASAGTATKRENEAFFPPERSSYSKTLRKLDRQPR
jgi:hypothetical protein